MTKELEEALKNIKIRCHSKSMRYDPIDFDLEAIEETLLKVEKLEKELTDVEKVKSGRTIIYVGKDLVMMNKSKYYEYLENENEPVSKRILQAQCETQEQELAKYKKAWEILKKSLGFNFYSKTREVEVYDLTNEEDYCFLINKDDGSSLLIEEEFDLLKEMLKC